MSKRFLWHDKLSGITHYSDYDASTRKGVHLYEGDSEPNLEHAKALRNDPDVRKTGIKKEMMLAAHVPPMVIVELRTKYGLDLFQSPREALRIIQRDYPDCLTTEKKPLV